MKRLMMAAAVAGTFAMGAPGPALAKGCKTIDSGETMACRAIPAGKLGQPFCLVPEGFDIRGVTHGQSPDPWATDQPIELGNVPVNPAGPSQPCNGHHVALAGAKVDIKARGNGNYEVMIAGKNIAMTATQEHGDDLWLSGPDPQDGNIHYFVFFRNKSSSADLPKFLFVEALDFSDGSCGANAPSLTKNTVVSGRCRGSAGPQQGRSEPAVKETGVGGGGEGGKNP